MQQTSWAVITGAPCSGKTAVISLLASRGQRVVPEVARAFIEELLGSGSTIEEIKADVLSFERTILLRKVEIEQTLPVNQTIFLDRGVPDSIAYFNAAGLDPEEPILKSKLTRYRAVFHFERLRFQKDKVRAEDLSLAKTLDRLLKQSYEMLGYDVIEVPAMKVRERADFILERMRAGAFSRLR